MIQRLHIYSPLAHIHLDSERIRPLEMQAFERSSYLCETARDPFCMHWMILSTNWPTQSWALATENVVVGVHDQYISGNSEYLTPEVYTGLTLNLTCTEE